MSVQTIIIAFEVIAIMILFGLIAPLMGIRPARAVLNAVEILAFMILSMLPAPRRHGRHALKGA